MSLRSFLKKMVFGATTVAVSPLALLHRLYHRLSGSERLFHANGEFLALIPGLTGSYLRTAYYCLTLKKCSSDCQFGFGTLVTHVDAELGKGVLVGNFAEIGSATLEDNVLVSSRVMIISARRAHLPEHHPTPESQALGYQRVRIGTGTWIGSGSIIMANLGSSCVIGAGSVVVKEIPGRSLAAGNPAKVIRQI